MNLLSGMFQVSEDQAEENMERLHDIFEKQTEKAAGFLHRIYPETSKSVFLSALNNPEKVRFTSIEKYDRFSAAMDWIETSGLKLNREAQIKESYVKAVANNPGILH